MPISPENRYRRLTATREAAAAFVEDMAHIRGLLGKEELTPTEIRHLSGILRRLVIDSDLRSIAPPRIGELNILAHDNSSIHHFARKRPLFLFARITVFNCEYRAIVGVAGYHFSHERDLGADFDKYKLIALRLDGFLNQNVLCLNNEWANRRQLVKYIAHFGSGVHSGTPLNPEDELLSQMRRVFKYYRAESGAKISIDPPALFDSNSTLPFKWTADAIDHVLIELLAAANFLSIFPKIKAPESMIVSELSDTVAAL